MVSTTLAHEETDEHALLLGRSSIIAGRRRSSSKLEIGASPKGRQSVTTPKGRNRQSSIEASDEKPIDKFGEEAAQSFKERFSKVALHDQGHVPMLAQLFETKKAELFQKYPSRMVAYEDVGFDTIMTVHAKYHKYKVDVWEIILKWEEFVALDVSGTGFLSFDEFKEGLKKAFKLGDGPVPAHLLDKEWRMFKGELDFLEYLEWTVQHAFTEEVLVPDEKDRRLRHIARELGIALTVVERIRAVYDKFDTNHSGWIDREEFSKVMTTLLKVKTTDGISTKALDRYWHEVDVNFSGNVDFEEFLHWYTMYFDE
jgi:Ca2+-binding EF-hand superfamily protein